MISMVKSWQGKVAVNGEMFDSIQSAISSFKTVSGPVSIKLYPKSESSLKNDLGASQSDSKASADISKTGEIRITVKKYMTEKSAPGFDFMARWNDDNPMPLRTMTGVVLQETKGMLKMRLHGDIWAEKICTCMCCGRKLTNPVSQYFGIGPECDRHNYVNPFNSDEELKEAVAEYKAKLQATVWEGWVIKSAITEQEEVC